MSFQNFFYATHRIYEILSKSLVPTAEVDSRILLAYTYIYAEVDRMILPFNYIYASILAFDRVTESLKIRFIKLHFFKRTWSRDRIQVFDKIE